MMNQIMNIYQIMIVLLKMSKNINIIVQSVEILTKDDEGNIIETQKNFLLKYIVI